MTFKEGIRSGLDNATNFEERATRAEFWWWALLVCLVVLATAVLGTMLPFSAALGGLFLLALLLPTVSIAIRRLHDLDRPASDLLWGLIPLFGWAYLLMLCTQAGDAAPNRYGRQ